jgi:hypothetical protein
MKLNYDGCPDIFLIFLMYPDSFLRAFSFFRALVCERIVERFGELSGPAPGN